MIFCVENWSDYRSKGELLIKHSQYAVVDLDKPVTTLDGETEYEMLCICPTEEKAVALVHLLNGPTRPIGKPE